MSQSCRSADRRLQYEICVKGHLAPHWSHWFEGFAIFLRKGYAIALKDNGETLLSGPVIDQAALYGVLIKVRDLGLPLISVRPAPTKNSENSNTRKMNHDYAEHKCAETDADNIHES
ncbi:MAG: hypothetical protein AAFR25_11480 [Cyanobacteria bacterium J06629_19]